MAEACALGTQAALLEAYAARQVDLQEHESAAAEVVEVAAVAARADVAAAKQLQQAAERQARPRDDLYQAPSCETSQNADADA